MRFVPCSARGAGGRASELADHLDPRALFRLFQKVKTKLGKGKQVAQNATDTSYKARSIALPNQSIGVVHDEGERLTKGGKTWEELRVGSRHYNVAIRRGAHLRRCFTLAWETDRSRRCLCSQTRSTA